MRGRVLLTARGAAEHRHVSPSVCQPPVSRRPRGSLRQTRTARRPPAGHGAGSRRGGARSAQQSRGCGQRQRRRWGTADGGPTFGDSVSGVRGDGARSMSVTPISSVDSSAEGVVISANLAAASSSVRQRCGLLLGG